MNESDAPDLQAWVPRLHRYARALAGNHDDADVLYWMDGPIAHAISAEAARPVLARISEEVWRQLGPASR